MFIKKHVVFGTGLYVARKWSRDYVIICHVILSHDQEDVKWIFYVKGQKFLFYVNVPDK